MDQVVSDAQLAKADGGSVETTNDLWHFFYKCLEKRLDRTAAISHHQPPDHLAWLVTSVSADSKSPCLSWTYRQLLSAADQVVHAFQASDVPSGTGLLTFIWNSVECLIFFLAAIKLRMHFVPLDPRLAKRTVELESTLTPVNPGAIIMPNEEAAEQFEKSSPVARRNCKAKIVLSIFNSQRLPTGWISFSAFIRTASSSPSPSNPLPPPGSSSDTAIILFTSGTTNRPKGTPHSIQNCVAESYAYIVRRVEPDSRILLHNPNFRAIFYAWTICAWRQASCLILAGESFKPAISLEAMSKHHATVLGLVPSALTSMVEHPRFAESKLPPLEYVSLGGDVVTSAFLVWAKQKLGARTMASAFGMTECVGLMGWEGHISDQVLSTYQGFVGVGRPGRGNKIKICEQGGRRVLRRGEVGELHVGGQGAIKGYLEGRFEELFYDDEEGRWFKAGDRVVMDSDGVVYVLGRFKDVIKRSGLAISPTVLEGHLNNEPGIKVGVAASAGVS